MSSYYVDEDYPAGPEIPWALHEWSNWCGPESATLESDVYVWRYALLVVVAIEEEEEEEEEGDGEKNKMAKGYLFGGLVSWPLLTTI